MAGQVDKVAEHEALKACAIKCSKARDGRAVAGAVKACRAALIRAGVSEWLAAECAYAVGLFAGPWEPWTKRQWQAPA